MAPDATPNRGSDEQEPRLAATVRHQTRLHPNLPPPRRREHLVTCLVITLGMALALLLGALHLGGQP